MRPRGTRTAKKTAAPRKIFVNGLAIGSPFPRTPADKEPCRKRQERTAWKRFFCTILLLSSARSSSEARTRSLKSPRSRLAHSYDGKLVSGSSVNTSNKHWGSHLPSNNIFDLCRSSWQRDSLIYILRSQSNSFPNTH